MFIPEWNIEQIVKRFHEFPNEGIQMQAVLRVDGKITFYQYLTYKLHHASWFIPHWKNVDMNKLSFTSQTLQAKLWFLGFMFQTVLQILALDIFKASF